MEEYVRKIITDESAKIRAELQNAILYGEPMDMSDPDMVIVAAVWKARQEESARAAKSMDVLRALRAGSG